jgi:hypothetical protein
MRTALGIHDLLNTSSPAAARAPAISSEQAQIAEACRGLMILTTKPLPMEPIVAVAPKRPYDIMAPLSAPMHYKRQRSVEHMFIQPMTTVPDRTQRANSVPSTKTSPEPVANISVEVGGARVYQRQALPINAENIVPRAGWSSDDDEKLRAGIRSHGADWHSIIQHFLPQKTADECLLRWFDMCPTNGTNFAPWTMEEDQMVRYGVQRFPRQWARIAKLLPCRSNQQIKQRWLYVLDPKIRNGPWSANEDQLLLQGLERFGAQWSKISKEMFDNARTNIQIRNRWVCHLDSNLNAQAWSDQDDSLLQQLHHRHGSNWAVIAASFPGRTSAQVRDRVFRKF